MMIAAISPASTSFENTYNTLCYAEHAKTSRTTIRNNVKYVDQHISDYIKIVVGLQEEVSSLQEKKKEYQRMEEEWKTEHSELKAAALQPSAPPQEVEMEVEEPPKEGIISEDESHSQNSCRMGVLSKKHSDGNCCSWRHHTRLQNLNVAIGMPDWPECKLLPLPHPNWTRHSISNYIYTLYACHT